MTELLTAAQMRAIEQAHIQSGATNGLSLMDRAGQAVVDAIFTFWPHLAEGSRHAAILCGPGNNGGDGFVIARILWDLGWEVSVFLYGDPANLPLDAKAQFDKYNALGPVRLFSVDPAPLQDDALNFQEPLDLLVDAVFGLGLRRPFKGVFSLVAQLRDVLVAKGGQTVAVDLPSGVCADSGRILGTAIPADLTVTFHKMKIGHVLGAGAELCGKTVVADIGLDSAAVENAAVVRQTQSPLGLGKSQGHKYDHGHVLVLSGGVGKGGAARLAARGALRIGAGAVTVGCPPAALIENAAQLNAIMLQPIKDGVGLNSALTDQRINALCAGPGLGLDARDLDLVSACLVSGRAAVLDADALTLLAGNDALFSKLHDRCILTPHAGEFQRLFPDIFERLNSPASSGPAFSKVDATRNAAKRAGCVVLFKGPDTVIADPAGRCYVNASVHDRQVPWLATAGAGDVLAGFIAGLLARGFDPMRAAENGAWCHAECARRFGPGLIAEDLPDQLPKVLGGLEL